MAKGYTGTLYFALKRVHVRKLALWWTVAGALKVGRLFGIDIRRSRYE